MKQLIIVMCPSLAVAVSAASRVEVPSLPDQVRPLAEVETNVVFSAAVAPTCFDPSWNMARIVSRGAESMRVESKITADALRLRIR